MIRVLLIIGSAIVGPYAAEPVEPEKEAACVAKMVPEGLGWHPAKPGDADKMSRIALACRKYETREQLCDRIRTEIGATRLPALPGLSDGSWKLDGVTVLCVSAPKEIK